MRDYMVRFWKRMLTLGKTDEDILFLKETGTITTDEYEAIVTD
jgi:hypothetical protein